MTLAASPDPTIITLVLRDISKRESHFEFVVPTAVWDPSTGLIADLKTIRDNLVTRFGAVTNSLIYRAFITLKQTDDTDTLGPAGSNLTEGAAIVCDLATAGKLTTIVLPDPVIGIFQGSTGVSRNNVDVADSDLNLLLDKFQTTGGTFTLSDGEYLLDTANPATKGRRTVRKVKAPLA